MNDAEFEKNLRYLLRPAQPSPELRARIQRELNEPVPTPPPWNWPGFARRLLRDFGWACAGATAALVLLALAPGMDAPRNAPRVPAAPASAPAAPTDAFEHDGTSNELLAAEDSDELIETDDGPAREVHYSYRERHEWSNPRTGASVVLEVPREDVYLLPVSLQ
jgi:hypothetical protein